MSSPPDDDVQRIPTAASEWKKETLELLNVEYDSRSVTDFTFNDVELPPQMQLCTIPVIKKF
jgi:hypothetical protein